MLERSDVDPDRVAVIGVSQAGYWVPRALAFEHRLAAAVVDPGVIDVSTSWLEPLPNIMRKQLEQGDRTAFDREMHLAELFSPGTAATLRFRGNPYGARHDSRYDLYNTVLRLQTRRRTTAHHHTTTNHRPPRRAILARAIPATPRPHPRDQRTPDRSPPPRAPTATASRWRASLRDARIFDWLDSYLA